MSHESDLETGVAYKLGIDQTNKGAIYYFTGEMSGYYGASSESRDDGVEVVLEAADGGYYVSFTNASGAKQYINVVQSGTYTNFTIADTASTVYTFDAEYSTLVTVLGEETYYMGTYNTFVTFGFSKYSYISTSFPAHLYKISQGTPEETEPATTEPETTEPTTTEPTTTEPAGSGEYVKVTSASEFTSGTYVMIVGSGYAPSVLENGWVLPVVPTVEGNVVTDTADAVWTLTVVDGTVILTDANGASIGPKASNSNGIKEDSHAWTWSFENGVFTFTSADGTVQLASNATTTSGENRFRAYKISTLTGSSASNYYTEFTLYKLDGSAPQATEPEATEPETTTAPAGSSEPEVAESIQAGVAYKLGLNQVMNGNVLYFSGVTADKTYRLATTDSAADAVDVYLEEVSGGYRLYFMDGQTKTYIRVYEYTKDNGYLAGTLELTTTEPEEYFTYDAQLKTLVYTNGENSYYLGTYSTYVTISVSSTYYITGDNAGNVDVSQFPAHLYVEGEGNTEATEPATTEPVTTEPATTAPAASEPTYVTEVQTGVAYKLGIDQTNKGAIYYFTGEMSGYYGASSESWDDGVEVVLEAADGGYYVSFTNASGAKQYINVVQNGTYTNFTIADTASTVYTFDAQYNTLVTVLGGESYYAGTYSTYVTFGFSKYSYISTSFPAHLYVIEGNEPEATEPEATEPETTEPETTEPAGSKYVKVTSASEFTSGSYVLVVSTGYAPGVLDGTWLSAVQPTVEGDEVTDPAGGVWTLTVNGDSVVITDANGVSIAPKGGNTNGIMEGSYEWSWSFADGLFTFAGTGNDTVVLASNTSTNGLNKFRGYKLTVASAQPAYYPSEFTVYKLV